MTGEKEVSLMDRGELPEFCFATNQATGKTITVRRGEKGYYPSRYEDIPADELNADLGVTKAQAAAMSWGSLVGWESPLANPASFDEEGKPNPDALRAAR